MSRDSPIKRVEGACCLPAPVRWSLLSPQIAVITGSAGPCPDQRLVFWGNHIDRWMWYCLP
ncbi:unnamed protein product, partial [Vitis vinifera]